ncbi:MAG: Rieske (2Fe-2S) protein [Proteobacteria bacterium]|nr:Rieske (2Fe-2S) protein [Pseudomonadota bacterium]
MTVLCRLADLAATGAKEIIVEDAGIRRAIFVVRHAGGINAYFNACPHARLPLNSVPDVFLDFSASFVFCANHGAHFEPGSGKCLRGPCKGESLKSFPIRVEDGKIFCADSDYTLGA